jgi:hypothetical protein
MRLHYSRLEVMTVDGRLSTGHPECMLLLVADIIDRAVGTTMFWGGLGVGTRSTTRRDLAA